VNITIAAGRRSEKNKISIPACNVRGKRWYRRVTFPEM